MAAPPPNTCHPAPPDQRHPGGGHHRLLHLLPNNARPWACVLCCRRAPGAGVHGARQRQPQLRAPPLHRGSSGVQRFTLLPGLGPGLGGETRRALPKLQRPLTRRPTPLPPPRSSTPTRRTPHTKTTSPGSYGTRSQSRPRAARRRAPAATRSKTSAPLARCSGPLPVAAGARALAFGAADHGWQAGPPFLPAPRALRLATAAARGFAAVTAVANCAPCALAVVGPNPPPLAGLRRLEAWGERPGAPGPLPQCERLVCALPLNARRLRALRRHLWGLQVGRDQRLGRVGGQARLAGGPNVGRVQLAGRRAVCSAVPLKALAGAGGSRARAAGRLGGGVA